ncbi:MAG: prepilin-type N-terminal cleavage/methylation domain-containing protein [Planctomycetaceae bacterium]|nr:prepilin-type N-terminal cleavage/methylation domain-containing protein [Planctomycetaceae bacterium]
MIVLHTRRWATGRSGLTLIELVLVIAILTVLGGLVVQGLPNMLKRTHLAKCSDTIWSLNNAWSQEFATSVRYPDRYDSLLSTGGAAAYDKVPQGLKDQTSVADLSPTDVAALNAIGITRVVDLATVAPGMNVTDRAAPLGSAERVLATTAKVAQLNLTAHESAPGGGNLLQLKRHLVRNSDGSYTDNRTNVRYIVFGIGPNCTAVGAGRRIQETPVHFGASDAINPATTYQRYLVVFSLVTDSTGLVTAYFEGAAGNDVTGPSSGESHIRQFHEDANRGA